MLQGRILLQIKPRDLNDAVVDQLDDGHSGVVLSDPKAAARAIRLRSEGYAGILLVDRASYRKQFASADAPFPELPEAATLFAEDALQTCLEDQSYAKATAALTPTGYTRSNDTAALDAAIRAVHGLRDETVVLTVPIDRSWLLREDLLNSLIRRLELLPNPKALVIGGPRDPLAQASAVPNLIKLIGRVPDVALLRSDLAAFGAFANGASFTAFGYTSGERHLVPPDDTANGRAHPPFVLFPELMRFFTGARLATSYAGLDAPVCTCVACEGRPLDAYPDGHDGRADQAAAHNVAVLMEWVGALLADRPDGARAAWWRERCRMAVARYPAVNRGHRGTRFEVDEQLRGWATSRPARA